MPGQRFGRLVTISKFTKNKAPYWKCQCDCGNITEVKASNLKAGYNVSCGCYFSEQNKLDLTNQKFGKLTAIKPLEERDERGAVLWECKCDCGNIFYATAHSLNYCLVQSCGCVHGASSKGEEKIQILLEEKNIKFQMQKTFDTCRFNDTNALARFDFYIDDTYLIEYDGEQHFRPVNHWGGEEKFQMQKIHDEYKNQWCKDNNIPLIRIPYDKFDTLTIEDLILETTQFRII